jgi:hypothetical protein
VRCSLLALSSYIDAELEMEPTGELEAHLLACDRCRTAIGHLREESERIGGLARVHIPDGAVHDMFSQIGLIEAGDDLPTAPPPQDRRATVEAPPWFGAERGKALPWAPRGRDSMRASDPRELVGERSPGTAVADPPELLLWDEPLDQIATSPVPPPIHVVPDPIPAPVSPQAPTQAFMDEATAPVPQPPAHPATEPQPPALGIPMALPPAPSAAGAPNAFQRVRDALAVRIALWRGSGSELDSGVEIVSGAGAPTWNQRAHPKAWSDSAPVVVAPEPPAMEPLVPPSVEHPVPPPVVEQPSTRTPELADVLGEVASLAAPLGRTPAPAATPSPEVSSAAASADMIPTPALDAMYEAYPELAPTAIRDADPEARSAAIGDSVLETASTSSWDSTPEVTSKAAPDIAPTTAPEVPEVDDEPDRDVEFTSMPVKPTFRHRAALSESFDDELDDDPGDHLAAVDELVTPTTFRAEPEPAAPRGPGRHLRRVRSQKPDRRSWNPTQPMTGRHVLPIGGPAVAAADRDRGLWIFAAITTVVLVFGLLIGRTVTGTAPLASAKVHRPAPTAHAITTAPPTVAPLPIATSIPVATGPPAPTPAQLTKITSLGSGSTGFTVADVRYGEHPNDFRLVFDLAYPDTVTGAPTTVVGYDGSTTLYVEFSGVDGTAPIGAMPAGQVVVSVVPLPMVRDTGRLIFKITLRKAAPYDAYYLSGGRLIIDVT